MSVDSLALGLYGSLTPRDQGRVDEDVDCFSAFVALGTALGWLASPVDPGPERGLWGMNDAGGPWFSDDVAALPGLFHVSPVGDDHGPLPVEPLTVAAVTTVERFGRFDLHGFELFAPLGGVGPAARRLVSAQPWFGLADPTLRVRLRITLDTGDSPAIVERADRILRTLAAVTSDEEGLDPHPSAETVDFPTPVPWRWWLGSGRPHVLTLSATATEWTSLGVGRVLACVVEACRAVGITDHVGVRLVRDRDGHAQR